VLGMVQPSAEHHLTHLLQLLAFFRGLEGLCS
jgi:hypothetical protein